MTDKLRLILARLEQRAVRLSAAISATQDGHSIPFLEGELDEVQNEIAGVRAALAAAPQPAMRDETGMEHIARDMREGRFPERSPRQQVPVEAEPRPAPVDREALVEFLAAIDFSNQTREEVADALLARGLRLPGGEETMAWAVVEKDGTINPNKISAYRPDYVAKVMGDNRVVRVAIRVVEGGDDAA